MSHLAGCITAHGVKTHNRLPADVKAAVAAGDTKLAVERMTAHLDNLKTLKTSVTEQHKVNKEEFMAQTISPTSAASYVNRADSDPTNELNLFKVKNFSTIWKNLVQRAGTFGAAVKLLVTSKDGATAGEKAVLEHFGSEGGFGRQMSAAINQIFQAKGMEDPKEKKKNSFKFRFEDMIQYFPVRAAHASEFEYNPLRLNEEHVSKNGVLDPVIRSAIAATAYEWLATDGRKSTGQTESTVRRLLGLQKDEPVSDDALGLLEEAGSNAETVARQLGKTILQRLSITAGEQSDAMAQSRMEESLGFMALAAMEHIGVLERQFVIADRTQQAKDTALSEGTILEPIGLEALKDGYPLEHNQVFYKDDGNENGQKGLLTLHLVKVVNIDLLETIEEKFKEGREAFDKIFANEPQEFGMKWKTVVGKAFRIGNTKTEANKIQTANIEKYNNIPYQRNTEAISFLKSMWDMANSQGSKEEIEAMKDIFYETLGAPAAGNLLELHGKSNASIRRGIKQDFEDVLNHEKEHSKRSKAGESTEFYLSSDFMANMRMIMRGDINPQNSKMHRSLFAPTGFQTTFKKSAKGKLDQAFLEAVAVAFDIETGKGIIGDAKKQVAELMDIFKNPDNKKHGAVTAAVHAIQEFNRTGQMTVDLLKTITAGSVAIDNKVSGLKGLFEYARYDALKAGQEFTTDLHAEIDGVSNGVIIGILQLIPDSADKRAVLATLAMGGISTNSAKANLNKLLIQHNLNDAYQRMAQEWALEIAKLKQKWDTADGKENKKNYNQAKALGKLLGEFQDKDGVINKIIRSLSKPRTMQIIYGAGIKKQMQLLAGENVLHDGIYKKVEKIIKRIQAADATDMTINTDFADLMTDVATVTNDTMAFKPERFHDQGKLSVEKLKAFKLQKHQITALNWAVANTYGLAMGNAINTVYGSLIEARKPLNAAVQLAVTTYNTILRKKIELLVTKHKADALLEGDQKFTGDVNVITKAELDVILKSIEHLFPKVKTPLHTDDDPSYLPMAEVGKNKNYSRQAKVVQVYSADKLLLHRGFAEGIPYLKDPGVAPIIKTIHMLDSMVANGLMGLDTHMLNNHDGFSHGIEHSDEIRTAANTIFAKTMIDYSLADAFKDMHNDLLEKGKVMLKELGISADEFLYGSGRETGADTAARTGGLFNDKVVSFELLAASGVVSEEAQEEYLADTKDSGIPFKTALRDYMRSAIAEYQEKFDVTDDQFIQEYVLGELTKNLKRIAEQTTRNKKEVTDATYQWMQYPHHGEGIDASVVTPTNTTGKIFGNISTNTILTVDKKATDKNIETLKDLVEANYGSSESDVSTDRDDYTTPSQVIDKKNAVEVLESLVNLDINMAHASIQDSPSHIEHLKGVLNNIVTKVMGPVEMFMDHHKINNETQGMWTLDSAGNKQIWVQLQQRSTHPQAGMLSTGVRLSAAEVYVHELVHHITHTGLKKFSHLQQQASDLRKLVFREFTSLYGKDAFRVFLSDPALDISDPANKFEVAAAKSRWEYVFNTKQKADGRHSGVDEFLSFGLTNENFRRELGKLNVSPEIIAQRKSLGSIFEKNIQQTIVNIFSMVLDFLYRGFSDQRFSTKVDVELENLVRAISYVDSKNKSVIWKGAMTLEGTLTALGLRADEKVIGAAKWAIDKTKIGKAITELKKLPELDNMLSHQMRIALHWYTSQQQGLIPALITEMNGTTDRLRPLHDMLRMRNYVIDVAKNEAAAVMRAINNEWFQRELQPNEKTAITKALLKTDISSLLGNSTSRAIISYVSEASARDARIAEIMQEIKTDPKLKDFADFFRNAADDMGYFMVNSAGKTKHSVPFMNAHNIVLMKQSKYASRISGESFDKAVDLVDQLITLYSLNYVSNANKQAAARVMKEDWTAVENTLNHHNVLKRDAFENLFGGNPALMTKGYVKQILNARIKFEKGTLADQKKFEDAGYYRQKDPIPRDDNDPVQEDIYMYKSMLGAVNDLQPGIASFTQNVGRGVVSYDLQHQIGNSADAAKIGAQNNKIVLDATLDKIDAMFSPRTLAMELDTDGNFMIPKFNRNGDMTEMRYMMNEHTKDSVLEQFSEFDAVLAAMTSQIVDKMATPGVNKELIVALKDMADKERKKFPEAYVEISPFSTEQRYKDIYHQLPPKAREQILHVWGENKMWVSQDVVDLAFGQRKYSVSETFGKDPRSRNLFENMFVNLMTLALGGHNPLSQPPAWVEDNTSAQGRAVRRTTAIFNTMAQLTKLGKTNIVVRNLDVVWGNHQSNMMYLKSSGVTLDEILRYNKEAVQGILAYQKDKFELETLKHKREIIALNRTMTQVQKDTQVTNASRRIVELENKIAINPVTKLVRAGAVPSIVDDVDTASVQSPHRYGIDLALDKGIDLLPKPLQKVGRTLFMTTDTEGFKMLNNAVKLTDFTARYILYNHLTSKGMEKGTALSEVMDKFINFDLPTHRMIGMLNDVGLLMFTKYQLRILKHIKDVVTEHPFSALATFLIGSTIGNNNIINSLPGITKSVMQVASNPFLLAAESPWDTLIVDGVQFVGGIAADVVIPGN